MCCASRLCTLATEAWVGEWSACPLCSGSDEHYKQARGARRRATVHLRSKVYGGNRQQQ